MNKIKKCLLSLAIFALGSISAFADNVLTLQNYAIVQGEIIDGIAINLQNTDEVATLQFELTLPENVTLVPVNGKIFQGGSRVPSFDSLPNGANIVRKSLTQYQFIIYNSALNPLTGNDGAVVTFSLKATEGEYDVDAPIVVSNVKAADRAGDEVKIECAGEFYNENSTKKYDFNNDGKVNVFDLQLVLNAINHNDKDLTYDLNSDGVVNVFDLQLMITAINAQ